MAEHGAEWVENRGVPLNVRARWIGASLALAVILAAVPVLALDRGLADAQSAFDAGFFARAAALARRLHTGEGYALASRAEMVRGEFGEDENAARRARFEVALADARLAVARDPARPEAHLAVAVALGLLARSQGGIVAHFEGLGTEARGHIDTAMKLNESNAWAHAALGGWHLEIAYAGGPLGRAIYGASVERGIAAYDRALALDPGNMSIEYQYAFQLAGLGGTDNLARASSLLGAIVAREPRTALEKLLAGSASELKRALDRGDKQAVQRIVALRLGRAAAGPADPRPGIGQNR